MTVTAPAAHGTNVTTAVAVAIGSTVQGDVANANGTNYFKVQVVAGQKYTFQTVLGSLYDSVLTLLGTNGQTRYRPERRHGPGQSGLAHYLAGDGQRHYYLAVSSYPGSPLGSFSLVTSGPAVSKSSAFTNVQPSGWQSGRSVAIPSATLQPAAAVVVLSSNPFGAATGSVKLVPEA